MCTMTVWRELITIIPVLRRSVVVERWGHNLTGAELAQDCPDASCLPGVRERVPDLLFKLLPSNSWGFGVFVLGTTEAWSNCCAIAPPNEHRPGRSVDHLGIREFWCKSSLTASMHFVNVGERSFARNGRTNLIVDNSNMSYRLWESKIFNLVAFCDTSIKKNIHAL